MIEKEQFKSLQNVKYYFITCVVHFKFCLSEISETALYIFFQKSNIISNKKPLQKQWFSISIKVPFKKKLHLPLFRVENSSFSDFLYRQY